MFQLQQRESRVIGNVVVGGSVSFGVPVGFQSLKVCFYVLLVLRLNATLITSITVTPMVFSS